MSREKIPQKATETIADLLDELPDELREKWERDHADDEEDERLSSLLHLVEGRRKALKSPRSTFAPRGVEVVDSSPLAIRQMIERLDAGEHEALGKGMSAKVIASVRNPEVAYKVFFSMSSQPLGTNDIATEAELQRAVAELGELHGVRAPKLHYFIENTNMRAIAMERLHAVSIHDVLDGLAPLPATFDYDRFFSALEAYVNALHKRGYYHRDLHGGNVLIDLETGMPYVIDFGMSTHTIVEDEAYSKDVPMSGQMRKMVYTADERMLRALRKEMLSFKEENL